MAATARANPTPRKAIPGRPPRPPRPPVPPRDDPDDGELISIGPPAEGEEEPEAERVPLFEIGGTVYTMLAEPPPTIGYDTLQVSDRKGSLGFGEVHLMRVMMGDDALNALLDAGRRGWLKKGQFRTIVQRVRDATMGALEDEGPNP